MLQTFKLSERLTFVVDPDRQHFHLIERGESSVRAVTLSAEEIDKLTKLRQIIKNETGE